MTFKHKLSARLALLRDALALVPLAALLACELPSPSLGPENTVTAHAPPATPGSRVGYYVTPNGSSSGNGSSASPWSLSFALGGAAGRVQPGDTVWLRGGRYAGSFFSFLAGTSASPIVVRQYPGERATIDGTLLTQSGSKHVWFWGFEVMRSVHGTGGLGINVQHPSIRLINLVVHDAVGSGIYFVASGAEDSEIYGCLSYNNGDNTNLDHGIYAHSFGTFTGTFLAEDNILFNNLAYGFHGYEEGAGKTLRNFTVRGNVTFNNNTISTSSWGSDLLIGGEQPVVNMLVEHNNIFRNSSEPIDHGMQLGYYGVTGGSLRLLNNYMVSTKPANILAFTSIVNTGNLFYTYAAPPTTNRVVVRRNKYEAGRANIIVYNWTRQGSVSVDVSGVLTVGDSYVVKNAQAFYGTPVVSGTYGGGALQLPMAGIPAPVPIGRGLPPAPVTGPTFNVFVLMKTP